MRTEHSVQVCQAVHAIGDKQGNINTGAKNLFADRRSPSAPR